MKNHVFTTITACLLTACVHAQSIAFLTKAEAAKAIVDDKAEPYFETLQPMEMSAKTGAPITGKTLKEQRDECRKRYAANTLDFSDKEQAMITALVKELQPILNKNYPTLGELPWNFIKLKDTIEGGLPHTRGAHIVFSDSMCKRFLSLDGTQATFFVRLRLLDILTHEQTHVFQRKYPKVMAPLYEKEWNFERATKITANAYLKTHHLSNPDAVECPWVFTVEEADQKVTYWPLVVFAVGDGVKRMPHDFRMVGVALNKTKDGYVVKEDDKGVPVSKPLPPFIAYRQRFPRVTDSVYHPDEIAAGIFGTMIVVDHFLPVTDPRQKAAIQKEFGASRDWFKTHLAKPKKTTK